MMIRHRNGRGARARGAGLGAAAVPLLLGGCSLPSIHLVDSTPAPFVQTDNLDAPKDGDSTQHQRQLFLGVVGGLRQQGRAAAALAFLDDYDRLYPRDPKAQLLRADCLMDTDQPQAAAPIYRRLLDGPQAAAARAGLGLVAASEGHWAEAAQSFAQATALAPSDVRYLNNEGYALLRAGDPGRAEFVLRQAAQLDPGNQQTRNNLMLCLQREGKPVPGLQVAAAGEAAGGGAPGAAPPVPQAGSAAAAAAGLPPLRRAPPPSPGLDAGR